MDHHEDLSSNLEDPGEHPSAHPSHLSGPLGQHEPPSCLWGPAYHAGQAENPVYPSLSRGLSPSTPFSLSSLSLISRSLSLISLSLNSLSLSRSLSLLSPLPPPFILPDIPLFQASLSSPARQPRAHHREFDRGAFEEVGGGGDVLTHNSAFIPPLNLVPDLFSYPQPFHVDRPTADPTNPSTSTLPRTIPTLARRPRLHPKLAPTSLLLLGLAPRSRSTSTLAPRSRSISRLIIVPRSSISRLVVVPRPSIPDPRPAVLGSSRVWLTWGVPDCPVFESLRWRRRRLSTQH
ncbi:hypothetical protein NMY22_g8109 [Coprinellus aureogranulatus]|nr:hypothetical protein NMY22_g8109 [Coprinellus aureogranulatus]